MSVQSSPEPMRELLASLNEPKSDTTDNNILTPRQKEVLTCLADGLSNKQIAYRLGVSEGTIKIHITLLLRALEVTNRLAAVRKAVQLGIIKEEK